jgi:hypothetical protein
MTDYVILYIVGAIVAYFPVRSFATVFKENRDQGPYTVDDRRAAIAFCLLSWASAIIFSLMYIIELVTGKDTDKKANW